MQGTAASAQEGALGRSLAQDALRGTEETATLAFVDQGYPGQDARPAARDDGIQLQRIRRKDATSGVVLLPCCWVVARRVGWVKRLQRLARDDVR